MSKTKHSSANMNIKAMHVREKLFQGDRTVRKEIIDSRRHI